MKVTLQHPYGTAAEIASYVGVPREVIVDTTNWRVFLTTGSPGGKPIASEAYVQAQVAAASSVGESSAFGQVLSQWSVCT